MRLANVRAIYHVGYHPEEGRRLSTQLKAVQTDAPCVPAAICHAEEKE